jgi:hypothetical protein
MSVGGSLRAGVGYCSIDLGEGRRGDLQPLARSAGKAEVLPQQLDFFSRNQYSLPAFILVFLSKTSSRGWLTAVEVELPLGDQVQVAVGNPDR